MNKTFLSLLAILLTGCNATTPMKKLDSGQTTELLSTLSGKYTVVDSRNNKYSKIKSAQVLLSEKGGGVSLTATDGTVRYLHLNRCKLANLAQMENFGNPSTSVHDMVNCRIQSTYQYARLTIGKVDSNFVIKDTAIIKGFESITITSGYAIEISEAPGKDIILNASKE